MGLQVISFFTYQAFLRWVREADVARAPTKAAPKRKPNRPRTPDGIRVLVLRLAKENSGILGELRKLGISQQARTFVMAAEDQNLALLY